MIFELGQNHELCPHSNIIHQMFFVNFISFHVLHDVWHNILAIFMILKAFSCADLFSRPLCWMIWWWMLFLCGFEYIAKDHHRYISQKWLEFVLTVREKSGIFFLSIPWQPWTYIRDLTVYSFCNGLQGSISMERQQLSPEDNSCPLKITAVPWR